MNIVTRFTAHGGKRLMHRTSLYDIDIDHCISTGIALNGGREPGSNRRHWLVWSERDEQSVDVVRDEVTKEVVTVLLEHYRGVRAIPEGIAGFVRNLARYQGRPSLREADLEILREFVPHVRVSIALAFHVPEKWRSKVRGVNLPLQEMTNLREPWRDPAILTAIWKKVTQEEITGLKDEIVIEQAFAWIRDGSAFTSTVFQESFKRPSS
ncbi:MAG TPA: hypothetical protein VFT82_03060 [Candidatus Paceibacterota bacterium]|nr:hypothetical protein [Candidatus Paceibacterota bacterium]